MNTILKTILFLGLAAALLFLPMSAAADENVLDPPTFALAASTTISLNSRGTAQCPVHGISVATVVRRPVLLRETVERIATVVPNDGRSTLLSSCLLRC